MNPWRFGVDKSERENPQGNSVIGGPQTFLSFTCRISPMFSHRSEKNPLEFPAGGEEKKLFGKTPENSVLNKACPREKLFYQSLFSFFKAKLT